LRLPGFLERRVALGRERRIDPSDAVVLLGRKAAKTSGHVDTLTRMRRANRLDVDRASAIEVTARTPIEAVLRRGSSLVRSDEPEWPFRRRFAFGPGEADLYISTGAMDATLAESLGFPDGRPRKRA
jgi:hypothetical protein